MKYDREHQSEVAVIFCFFFVVVVILSFFSPLVVSTSDTAFYEADKYKCSGVFYGSMKY